VDVQELDDSFPRPTPAALSEAARLLASIPDGRIVLVDGLAFGAMPSQVEPEASRLRLIAIVHLPLALEVGVEPAAAARLEASERRALAAASLVVVTGAPTIASLERFGVARDRIELVEPGTDPAPLARGSGGTRVQLLCVATLNPGKGHEILIRALASLAYRDWNLTCVGDVRRYPETVDCIRAIACAQRLEDRVTLVGELHEAGVAAAYDRADLFVLATLRETYGMAVAEALARGLPVVSTMTGAIPDLVGADAGLLVPPGDEAALTAALSRAVGDADLRNRMAAGARRVRDRLPTWDDAAEKIEAAIERIERE
jgi:glycosyltransferase involved in cell wall biosynthesis